MTETDRQSNVNCAVFPGGIIMRNVEVQRQIFSPSCGATSAGRVEVQAVQIFLSRVEQTELIYAEGPAAFTLRSSNSPSVMARLSREEFCRVSADVAENSPRQIESRRTPNTKPEIADQQVAQIRFNSGRNLSPVHETAFFFE